MTVPTVVREVVRDGVPCWYIACPVCGLVGTVDEDQYKGRVSIDCTNCAYHETHNIGASG